MGPATKLRDLSLNRFQRQRVRAISRHTHTYTITIDITVVGIVPQHQYLLATTLENGSAEHPLGAFKIKKF